MPTTALVPIDGSSQSYAALAYVLRSFPNVPVTTLHVIDVEREWYEGPTDAASWEERPRKLAEEYHDRALELASQYGADVETETAIGVPHKRILEYVVENDVDHVSMGSHGRSPITRPFVGHVTEAIARRAPVTVTIVPESMEEVDGHELPGRILVPVDGSEQAEIALEYAISEFPDATITAIHVIDLPFEYTPAQIEGTYLERQLEELREGANDLLATIEERATALDSEILTATTDGKPAQSIVAYAAENGFDQIVMGSYGRSGVPRVLLGSVAETVAQRSPIPVTIVR